jgi:hypothetical protein
VAATNFMIARTGAMLIYGPVRASVLSAIACRTLASLILPEFLTFVTRAAALVLISTFKLSGHLPMSINR